MDRGRDIMTTVEAINEDMTSKTVLENGTNSNQLKENL